MRKTECYTCQRPSFLYYLASLKLCQLKLCYATQQINSTRDADLCKPAPACIGPCTHIARLRSAYCCACPAALIRTELLETKTHACINTDSNSIGIGISITISIHGWRLNNKPTMMRSWSMARSLCWGDAITIDGQKPTLGRCDHGRWPEAYVGAMRSRSMARSLRWGDAITVDGQTPTLGRCDHGLWPESYVEAMRSRSMARTQCWTTVECNLDYPN